MLIDQQQTATETLQEYIQRFLEIVTQIQWLTTMHQAKDLAHITHFICNLHNHNLQYYVFQVKIPPQFKMPSLLAQKIGCGTPHYQRFT